jgi:4-hydroxy-tetrahydrodipicolinate synthase
MKYELEGIGAVNPTAYHANGRINESEYRRHIRWLADEGVRFIQPAAGTGQSLQLKAAEYRRLLEISVEEIGDRAFVTAYPGRPDPDDTLARIDVASEVGAHAAFIIQPFFSLPDDEGVYLYYKRLAERSPLPLVFYNNPTRAGINLSVDVMERLVGEHEIFVGLKQTNLDQFPDAVRRLGSKIRVLPRSEHAMLFGFALGAPGILTFAANIIPGEMVRILNAWKTGDFESARQLYLKWLPLFDIIHVEPVPNAIHYILNRLGWDFGVPRVPGHLPSPQNANRIDAVLASTGLLGARESKLRQAV